MKTTTQQKAKKSLISAIMTEHGIEQRLLEIVQEVQKKMENGISAPFRLEKEFQILSKELSSELNKKAEAEVVLGMDKNLNFTMN
jgi:predicted nucleic acid-binding protein